MRYLSDDDLRALIRSARERQHVNARRDHAILCVLANLGVRPGEAVRIERDDLHLQGSRPWVRVRRLKKRRALGVIDDLPMSQPLARVLRTYVRYLPDEVSPRIFPVTVRQLERLFHYYAKRARLPEGLRLYSLRHTAATRALDACGNLREVQVLLGHSRITTTEVYAHVRPEKRQELAARVGVIV